MATVNYSWTLPTVGGSEDTWGTENNTLWTDLDTLLGGVNATEFAILDGATVTTAELNILDGVTATTAELNILDGVTSTTAELNILDGVTVTTAEINNLSGITAAGAALLDDANAAAQRVTLDASQSPLDEDDFATDSATRPPSQQSTKAYVDAEVAAAAGTTVVLGILSSGSDTEPHGLGATPRDATWYLECTTADGNFAVGDRVFEAGYQTAADASSAFTVWANSTVAGFALSGTLYVPNKNTTLLALTTTSWTVHAVVKS